MAGVKLPLLSFLTENQSEMEYYLLFFVIAYFLITFILPTRRVWRRTGVNPFVVPNDDSAQGFTGKVFRILTVMTLVAVGINAFIPDWNQYLLPVWYFERESLRWLGWLILHASLLLIVIAQSQMKESWRIGIDEKNRTELISSGIFRFSRNPIFLGMRLTMGGLVLVLPNALTVVAYALTWTVLQIQVRMEEAFLTKMHGETYQNYLRTTPRWF